MATNEYGENQRGRNQFIFVNRFSAPGGAETAGDANGGPGLDIYSAELSAYNDLNWRNSTVRFVLQKLLTSHVNQFGYFSAEEFAAGSGVESSSVNPVNYEGTGSFYQVNRNAAYSINPQFGDQPECCLQFSEKAVAFTSGTIGAGSYRMLDGAPIEALATGSFTLALWIKPTALEAFPTILRPFLMIGSFSSPTYTARYGMWSQDGKFYAGVGASGTEDGVAGISGSSNVIEDPIGNYSLDTWYLLVLTHVPGFPLSDITFTVCNTATGDQQVTSKAISTPIPPLAQEGFGRWGNAPTAMDIHVDDLSILTIAASQAQITQMFECGPNNIEDIFDISGNSFGSPAVLPDGRHGGGYYRCNHGYITGRHS